MPAPSERGSSHESLHGQQAAWGRRVDVDRRNCLRHGHVVVGGDVALLSGRLGWALIGLVCGDATYRHGWRRASQARRAQRPARSPTRRADGADRRVGSVPMAQHPDVLSLQQRTLLILMYEINVTSSWTLGTCKGVLRRQGDRLSQRDDRAQRAITTVAVDACVANGAARTRMRPLERHAIRTNDDCGGVPRYTSGGRQRKLHVRVRLSSAFVQEVGSDLQSHDRRGNVPSRGIEGSWLKARPTTWPDVRSALDGWQHMLVVNF